MPAEPELDNQEPITLKKGFKIYPWDIVSVDKIGWIYTIQLGSAHIPLVIGSSREPDAYAQCERLFGDLFQEGGPHAS